ncbi:hypothetical protein DPMN_151302 [Dreissena polymorpha]|uniref:VWFA domain-containing protein n=1 Tax=Dreissena polymorpha TaxID=45954 RepID=A0A9D4FJN7_DREPO|nr:hypothetical protein DPMN_151302 [Dreissena polymorpha]
MCINPAQIQQQHVDGIVVYIIETGVVGQTKQYFLPINEEIWKALSRNALNGVLDRTRRIRGVVSVLCVDISESMSTGNAWGQANMFVNDFLTGLEEGKSKDDRILDEYVALVTFGHGTKIQQVLTNDYNDIRCQIESIALSGPSPLNGGLSIGHACAISAYENAPSFHGLILTPKLIVITDGRPTETRLIAGPDFQDESHMEEILSDVATAVREIDISNNHILFIGVGDYN